MGAVGGGWQAALPFHERAATALDALAGLRLKPGTMPEAGHVTELRRGDRTITIVGTAHVSRASVEEVSRVIDEVRPDTVCVELDRTRYDALIGGARFRDTDVARLIRERRVLFFAATVALTAFQRRLGERLGVEPGAELRAAVERAKAVGAEVVLADRDVQATLKRAWRSLRGLDRVRLLTGILAVPFAQADISTEDVEELKNPNTISELLGELGRVFPGVKGPLIDERDQYLMSMIEEAPGQRIVAVVGAGHVDGMLSHQGEVVDRARLLEVPAPSVVSRGIRWLLPLAVSLVFAYAALRREGADLLELLFIWSGVNAGAVTLFAVAARAHPLTLLFAALFAPIGAFFPRWGTGAVSGLVQARVAPPGEGDRERLLKDATSIRGIYRNRLTRALLVVGLVTLGSTLGALVAAMVVVLLV